MTVYPKSPPAPESDLATEIDRLAAQYKRANGPVMSMVNRLGGSLESQMKLIPPGLRTQLERATESALHAAYGLAGQGKRLPDVGPNGQLYAAMASGAAGGAGGIVTSIAELPVTVTVILHAIRQAAAEAGYDPDTPWIQAECLKVFGAGSPMSADDGVNTSFLSARLTVTGPAVQRIIATVAPRLAATLGQKVMAQAVPVLGALTGAALNAAFLSYYRDMARIRFALLRLTDTHGAETVMEAFGKAVQPPKVKQA